MMFEIFKISDRQAEPLRNNRGTMIPLVGKRNDSQKVDVHIIVLRPGGPNGPYHYHEHTENVYWVLEGKGILIVDRREYSIEKDDMVYIPPKTCHSLSAYPDVEMRLLEIYAPADNDFVVVD